MFRQGAKEGCYSTLNFCRGVIFYFKLWLRYGYGKKIGSSLQKVKQFGFLLLIIKNFINY